MGDFCDVGGVKLPVSAETWIEKRHEIGDVAGDDGLALSGRPIESRAAVVRRWMGQTTRSFISQGAVAGAVEPLLNNQAKAERMMRWIEGWGQCFPLAASTGAINMSGAGFALAPTANITMNNAGGPYNTGRMTVASGTNVAHALTYSQRIRRGFSATHPMGWTFGFYRNFIAAETVAAGWHWCVMTGKVAYAQGSGNPANVTQYVDGAASNWQCGSCSAVSSSFNLYGEKTDGVTASAIDYADVFFVPFQMPSNWISSIWTNIIQPGYGFPVLPRQKLTGQWLTGEPTPVEVIGRVESIQQRVGRTPGAAAWENDLRELAMSFLEW